ncbi:MAG: hypothetical protein WC455_19975 [Dehalococcoidia bacterium]|jgi:hypothetical protein
MLSGNELLDYTREYIHEAIADFWTDAKLLVAFKMSQKKWAMKMQRAAERVFYTSCVIPFVAGTGSYLLPNGTDYSAAKKCMGKIDFIQTGTDLPLQKCDYRRFYDATTRGTPKYIAIVGNYFHVRPIPQSNANYNLFYPYFPTAIALTGAEIDFIEGYEGLIALDVAKTAMLKDEADVSDIRMELAELWNDFKSTYCGNRIEGEADEPQTSIYEEEE